MNRKNPCFDESTGIDCADRCAECATSCKRWAEYVEARNESYKTVDVNKLYRMYEADTLSKLHAAREKDKRHGRRGVMR